MTRRAWIWLNCCLLGAYFCCSAQAAGYLHRSHTAIVDGSGKPLPLRGVNLGNWLYIEPWMIGNTGFAMFQDEDGKADEMAAAVTDVVGANRADAFFSAWRDNAVTHADIERITGLGFNSVRVPLDYRLFYDKSTGRDVETGFQYLDKLLVWCAASHLYVILDMHSMPGGKLGWVKGNIYDDPKKQDILAHVWGRIASHYQSNPWIGGYDLVNEPAVWDAAKLGSLYKKLIRAVRAVDTHHLVIVEGDAWGSRLDLLGMTTPSDAWDSNLALSNHAYGSPLSPSPLTDLKQQAAKLDLPLWMGEFGYNSNVWNHAIRGLAEKADPNPEGWCLWAYKSSGIWSLTRFDIPDGYRRLMEYWNGKKRGANAPKPSAKDAGAALTALAQGTSFARCTNRPDVSDGLLRADFPTRAIPYQTGLTIPGRIPAIAYDMGGDGAAYHDTVSTDEAGKGPAGRAWNDGWNGRNDGVDIYPQSDGGRADYDIGGIQSGEWTQYTVSSIPGDYTLQIRYRSPTGGKMHAEIGGVNVSDSIALPATGNWQTYGSMTVPVSVMASGKTILRLSFDTDGFSVRWVEFRRKK